MKAEAHDRINVQNNPVNAIDPLGLQGSIGVGVGFGPDPCAHPVFWRGTQANDIITNDISNFLRFIFSEQNLRRSLTVYFAANDPQGLIYLKKLSDDALAAKMEREISRIGEKERGPQGIQYSLRATVAGEYPDARGGTAHLEAGEVWKYGETTNPESRYSASWLKANKLDFRPEYTGSQVEIKVMEKVKIYGYFFSKHKLPPGNKIFR